MNTNTGGLEGGLIEGLRQNAGWVTGIGILLLVMGILAIGSPLVTGMAISWVAIVRRMGCRRAVRCAACQHRRSPAGAWRRRAQNRQGRGRLNPGGTSVSRLPGVDSLSQDPRVLVPGTPT